MAFLLCVISRDSLKDLGSESSCHNVGIGGAFSLCLRRLCFVCSWDLILCSQFLCSHSFGSSNYLTVPSSFFVVMNVGP